MGSVRQNEDEKLYTGIAIFNAKVTALITGLICGFVVFVATNWLVLKGGHIDEHGQYVVGPHLQLLSQFFIGYRVSFLGSIVGFFYDFAIGSLCGVIFGRIYNKIVDIRNSSRSL